MGKQSSGAPSDAKADKVIAVEEKDENENTDWCEVKPRRMRTKSTNASANADSSSASPTHEIDSNESDKVREICCVPLAGTC